MRSLLCPPGVSGQSRWPSGTARLPVATPRLSLRAVEPSAAAFKVIGMRRRLTQLLRKREEPEAPPEPTCYFCGRRVEDSLARLGSITCHDCRPATTQPPVRAEA